MATVYGVNKTIIDAITPSTVLDAGHAGGNVRCMLDSYVADGTETTGTIIEMGNELPVGAKIIDVLLTNHDASSTLDVGTYEDVDIFIGAGAVSAVSRLDEVATAPGQNYEVDMTTASTPDNQIILTVGTATLTSGTIIRLAVMYTVE